MSSPLPPGSEQSNDDHQPTVLLVDDEPAVRSALRRFFARRGWSVVEAADGESACGVLEPSSGNAFELVICDLNMPRLSGRDLYAWVARNRPDALALFVFSSGDVISAETSLFLTQSGRPVLPKPFELSELGRIADDVSRSGHGA